MFTLEKRKYPIGVQSFTEIVKGNYVYVDKTDLIYKLINSVKYTFLNRPRRFGKSLLSSTLHCYFEGQKELFKGLKIDSLESEWAEYPVLHFDLSMTKNQLPEGVEDELFRQLHRYELKYGEDVLEKKPGQKLAGIIERAAKAKGRNVVVIVDEYDAALLDNNDSAKVHRVMQEFYMPLKVQDRFLKFVFITGITKFSQLSIFSTINNLKNISMMPEYSAICGITESEVHEYFDGEVAQIADKIGRTKEEMYDLLKYEYDGYHFSFKSEDIYNPFSLMNAFSEKRIVSAWFASGTPTFLIEQMARFNTDITKWDELYLQESAFDRPTDSMPDALPLLYQSGYLTIKEYDYLTREYKLEIPNNEVRIGLFECLIPTYTGLQTTGVQGFVSKLYRALNDGDIERIIAEMRAFFESIPYMDGFKKKLDDVVKVEAFYEYVLYLVFSMVNTYVRTQVRTANGRADVVVFMPKVVYVFELKLNGSAEEALAQIEDKGYAIPYGTDERKVVKCGINFSTETKNIEDYRYKI